MGILRDFEKRLEGAVEGFFARAFRSGLQPVELAKAVQRYAAGYQQVGIDGVYIPNVYRFELAADDFERFRGFQRSLESELADVVRRTADERGWRLRGRVQIELRESSDVNVGTYELRGKIEGEEAPVAVADEPVNIIDERPGNMAVASSGSTRIMEAPRSGQRAWLHVLGEDEPGRRVPLTATAVIGRLPECDITLEDPSVSRRHARVSRTDGGWAVEDLGSTNGLRVNGERVDRATLRNGDRIQLGAIRLAFALED